MTTFLRTQGTRPLAVGTSLGDDVLLLKNMEVHEHLGRPFQMELELLSEDHQIDLEALVGENVTVRCQVAGEDMRYFNGYVHRFTQQDHRGELAEYRATLVPWVWFLTRNADCRVFQNQTVPDIVTGIFRELGFTDFDDQTSETYLELEYCVQYRESDFAFVSRLLEQEGIYYFFRHEDGRHVLVLADAPSSHETYPGYEQLDYCRWNDEARTQEWITDWTTTTDLKPGCFAVNSFDFVDPRKSLQAKSSALANHSAPDSEIYDYDAHYIEYDQGERYARLRMEEAQVGYRVSHGRTDARGMHCGSLFELAQHPREDLNTEYLVLSTVGRFHNPAYDSSSPDAAPTVEFEFRCIDAQQPFRSARETPRPTIQGPQTAIVVGKEGEEIWTDEHGRIKVLFHWDRYGCADENSSCWIRVAQMWAGNKWGSINIPRVGQEVVVEFLEGDPNRPLVTGRVYNGAATPPYPLPDHATISGVKTNSSKGGEGFNELRFEDKKDEEQVFLHAQKNLDVRVKNDRFETIENSRHLVVETDKLEHVKNNRHELVGTDHYEEIGTDRHLKVGGKQAVEITEDFSLTVSGDMISVFDGNHSEETTGDIYLKAAGIVIEATDGLTLKCGDNAVVIDSSGVTVGGSMVTIEGDLVNINSGSGSSAGSGEAGSAVSPSAPEEAEDADEADPGEVEEIKAEQRTREEGKYGSVPAPPFQPADPEDEEATWIEIELLDDDDQPVPGERYEIELPDGSVLSGTLDSNGFARVEGVAPGDCQITFPEYDEDAWEEG